MKQYSLSELAELVRESIELTLPNSYWVRAEISSISERGGHLYMELIEKGDKENLIAKQRATCWSNIQTMLQAYFEQETGSRPQQGMQILVETTINYHAVYGLTLNIINIDPHYTLGDMARQRQATIQQLQDEGIMDMQQTLALSTLTRRIAVISSDTAAGYGDFEHQLHTAGYAFHTTLFGALMQGEQAERSIIAALRAIAERENEFDAVVIIRGGGASSDLNCFDRYALCAHCAQFPLPILSGIGHTRDISVLDMVVHQALKTPTAVAAFLIDRIAAQANRIDSLKQRLRLTANRQILLRQRAVDTLQQRLRGCTQQMLLQQTHRIDMLQQKIDLYSPEQIFRRGYSLTIHRGKVVRNTEDITSGDLLTTYLAEGTVQSIVQ